MTTAPGSTALMSGYEAEDLHVDSRIGRRLPEDGVVRFVPDLIVLDPLRRVRCATAAAKVPKVAGSAG